MPEASRRIRLEIDGEQGLLLHGRVAEADGPSREFEGWLGLLTVLGSLLDGPAPGAEPSSPSAHPSREVHP
jgi:hypothetical protein